MSMTALQALVFAAIQGITELFPISSLGHAVVIPRLFGWRVDQQSPSFLPFLVVLHVGTALALLGYFWRDWVGFVQAIFGSMARAEVKSQRRLLAMLIIGTIPAVIVGFALEHALRSLFGSPPIAAVFLIVNGVVLLIGERLRTRNVKTEELRAINEIDATDALMIGICQCTALIPGISRSGATMVGGLLRGLSHEAAAHFSFLLATPIIAGAAVLEVPKLIRHGTAESGMTLLALLAGIVAGVTAWLSVFILMRYFKRREFEALDPFAYYCIAFGVSVLIALSLF
jgi:undecaprenyl-diphosphatase